jgi:hypothetical protein
VVLDNDATQQLAGDSAALDVLRRAVRDGRLQLLATHVLRDEVAAWRIARKRAPKEALLADAVDVPTGGIIFDQSKFDQMAWAPDDEAFDRLMRGDGQRHGHDALISSTALAQNAALVSRPSRPSAPPSRPRTCQPVPATEQVDIAPRRGRSGG